MPGVERPDAEVLDLEAAELSFRLCWRGDLADYVTAIAFDPTGRLLAASSAAGEVAVWSVARLPAANPTMAANPTIANLSPVELLAVLQEGDGTSVDCLAFSGDGNFLAAAGQSGHIYIWQISEPGSEPGSESGTESVSEPAQLSVPTLITTLANASVWVDHLAWHPHRAQLAYTLGKYVQIWDVKANAILATLNFEQSSVLDLAWHPTGTHLAIAGYQGLKIWDAADWDADPRGLEIPSASVAIAWSQDGQYLAAGNLDRTIAVVEWGNSAPWVMRGFPGKIRHLAWSNPSQHEPARLAVASASSAILWEQHPDAAIGWTGQILGDHDATLPALAFQPGTSHLATAAADGWIGIWQNACALVQTLDGAPQGFNCLSWHPQGIYLAAGGQRGELFLWGQTSPAPYGPQSVHSA